MKVLRCKRCGYEWGSRKKEPPVRCAKCRTPYWDTERISEVASGSQSGETPQGQQDEKY